MAAGMWKKFVQNYTKTSNPTNTFTSNIHTVHTLTGLYIYPVKSLGGIALPAARVQRRGLQYDRRWMLVDAEGRFISQREINELALLNTAIEAPFLTISHKKKPAQRLQIPLEPAVGSLDKIQVQIWDDHCSALLLPPETNEWFSEMLGQHLRLVYMPDSTERPVDARYVPDHMPVSFADGYPFLIIGQASLDQLNQRLDSPLPMNRFRPNFVVSTDTPHEEDAWQDFRIGDVPFRGVKRCARCIMPTVDQETAERGAEPLKALSTYRFENNKILFGQNLIWTGENEAAEVQIGDSLSF